MDHTAEVLRILDEVLGLRGKTASWNRDFALLGAVPELDSMAVVSLLTALADQFGISIDDDDIDGSIFTTVGSLIDFVTSRVSTQVG